MAAAEAGESGGADAGAGSGSAPEGGRVIEIPWQLEIFILEGADGGFVAHVFAGDGAKLRCPDERLARQHTTDQQPEDDEDDGELDEREGAGAGELHGTSR